EDIKGAMEMGISLFAGEAEGRLEGLFRDAYAGALKPLYNYLDELPGIESEPGPFLPSDLLGRSAGSFTSFDAGRGCPFKCSFCTIINVQGKKSRRRSARDVERIIRENVAQGITRFFITDDNFARNRDWEEIFDCLIKLQDTEHISIRLTIQVDTMCHRIPGFIEKAGKAGVARVFIGLENINPENLKAAGKSQNKIAEYRRMLLAWRSVGAITCAGYILGFPSDTPESIIKDIKTIQQELPVDLLEFFFLTPLPGSEDHRRLYEKGAWMNPDMNNYDLNHVTTMHPAMSKEEWEGVYRSAWDTYYTPGHIETVLRRARASGMSIGKTLFLLLWFYVCIRYEGLHPLEGGYFRHKYRLDRRPGLPIESALVFYPRRLWEIVSSHVRMLPLIWKCTRMRRRIKADPEALNYTDSALKDVSAGLEEYEASPEALGQSN
ncbi:MAG: B12-binding domain-containing radical SAM protein, partial [Thermodesulfobacteriota bacterium]